MEELAPLFVSTRTGKGGGSTLTGKEGQEGDLGCFFFVHTGEWTEWWLEREKGGVWKRKGEGTGFCTAIKQG